MDDLCQRLADDLDGAFVELVLGMQDLVYGVARRSVGQPDLAEDVAQETFVKAYRALARYDGERIRSLRLRPWLASIALNVARNELRRRRPLQLDDVAEPVAADHDGPLRLAERREAQQTWRRLLAELPERYRLAVGLRHVDGLSYGELAEVLDRPLGSVKSDVHRGTALLRAAYDAEQRRVARKEAV
jgi:RNA polymerase sigma factor (sigma-70 family)